MFVPSLIFVLLGVTLLITQRLIFTKEQRPADNWFVLGMSIMGWLLIMLAVVTLVSLPGLIVVLLMAGMFVAKYQHNERRALLWNLAVAAEKQIPLHVAARAFAARRCDETGRRAGMLADSLASGVALPEALRQSGHRLTTDAWLATHLGNDTGLLANSLRAAAEEDGQFDEIFRPIFERTLYLQIVTLLGIVLLSFGVVWGMPTLREIVRDYGLDLPPYAQLVMEVTNWLARHWWIFLPVAIYALGCFFMSAFHYSRGSVWQSPLMSRILGRFDSAYLLRGLSLCVRREWPLEKSLTRLAEIYPNSNWRTRLRRSADDVREGKNWCDSLYHQGLIRATDATLLRAAAKANNLQWAIDELADSSARRLRYRAKSFTAVVMPVALIFVAIPIAMWGLCVMQIIASLIHWLAAA